MIKELTVVTSSGVKIYKIGDVINDKKIATIKIASLFFTGNPYDHYIGYDDEGKIMFSVNCLAPCDIIYL